MSSKEVSLGEKLAKMPLNSSDSSEGEEAYDDMSYGSDIQSPDLAKGFVMVHENCCRARYRPSRVSKGTPFYVCLNKSDCRSLAGGQHAILRGGHRAVPGVYRGVYGPSGKLLAAKAGTQTTPATIEKLAAETRESDRAQAATIGKLSADMCSFSIPDTENLFATAEIDPEVEGPNPTNFGTKQNTILLRLMSSLCDKIDKLDSGIENGNTAIIQALTTARPPSQSILHPPSFTTTMTEEEAISSMARKHAAHSERTAPRNTDEEYEESRYTKEVYEDKEVYGEEYGREEESDWSETPTVKKTRKKAAKVSKSSSRPRLYAIAWGRGGQRTTGLYREDWDTIEFLVSGFSKGRFKRVRGEAEGMEFIKNFFRSKDRPKPKWMRDGKVNYPRVSEIRKHLGMEVVSSDEENISSSDSGFSSDDAPPRRLKKASRSRVEHKTGVDASSGKDSELFGVDLKSVNVLERGLAPSGLGKHTTSLFLEQIDDMTAYPRHTHQKTSESLGDFVEAVTDLSNQNKRGKGGQGCGVETQEPERSGEYQERGGLERCPFLSSRGTAHDPRDLPRGPRVGTDGC